MLIFLIYRRSNHVMHGRSDHRGRGRLNNQEGEGLWKKPMVSEPTSVVSTAHLEKPSNVHLHDHLASVEVTEKSGSYPQGRRDEESAAPMFDSSDSESQVIYMLFIFLFDFMLSEVCN